MSAVVYDENFIRNFLKKTIEELDTPFIERRINSGGTKENLQDEIIELLQIINENEEQIKTLVQLGYYLVEKGQENLYEKQNDIENLQQQILSCETDIEFHKQSIHEYQRLYHDTLDKNNKLQATMAQIESESSNNLKAVENVQKELQKLRTQSQKMGKPEDIENIKQNLILTQQENTELKHQLTLQKSDNKTLRDEITTLTKTYEKSIKNTEKIEYETKNQKNVIKTLEFKIKEQKIQIQKLEELCSIQLKEIEEIKRQNNSLERDLVQLANRGNTLNSVPSPRNTSKADMLAQQLFNDLKSSDEPGLLDTKGSFQFTGSPSTHTPSHLIQKEPTDARKSSMQIFLQAHGNLLSELKDQKDCELLDDSNERIDSRPRSNSSTKIKLDVNNLKTTGIVPSSKPQPIRRDPYEEFFVMTTQCVKLNSPYMDDILALDTSQYYKQALEQYIPYHKWAQWIQEQLHGIRQKLLKEQETDQMLEYQLIQY